MEGIGGEVGFGLHTRLRREGYEAPTHGSSVGRRKGVVAQEDVLDMGRLTDFIVNAAHPTAVGVRAFAMVHRLAMSGLLKAMVQVLHLYVDG